MSARVKQIAQPVERRLYSYSQAAQYLSIGVRYVERLVAAGELPKTPIGHRVLIDKVDLDAFIARKKASA